MTNERAIEILDPEHREQYDSIETVNEACRIGMNAIKRVHELEAENAELHKALDEIKVFGLEMKNGEVDMTVGSDTFNYITAMLVQMLEQNNAKNFLTTAIEVGNQKYSVTVQKNGGKTPSEELSELKTENAALRERLNITKMALEYACLETLQSNEQYLEELKEKVNKYIKQSEDVVYGQKNSVTFRFAEARCAELKGEEK